MEATALELLGLNTVVLQVGDHIITEETPIARRDTALRQALRLRKDAEISCLGVLSLLRANCPRGFHGRKHVVTPCMRTFRICIRIEPGGLLNHAREQSGLRDIQIGRGNAKVCLSCSFHAERAIAEGDQVQVLSQNLVFRQLIFQIQRDANLADLATIIRGSSSAALRLRLCVHQQRVVLNQLLLNCGGAFLHRLGHEVLYRRTSSALPVHTRVLIKAPILHADQRILHSWRDAFRRHIKPPLIIEPRNWLIIPIRNSGDPRCVLRNHRPRRRREFISRARDEVGRAAHKRKEGAGHNQRSQHSGNGELEQRRTFIHSNHTTR